MSQVLKSATEAIGNTPLVRLDRLTKFYDVNNDGTVNEYDFEELLSNLLGESISNGILDLNSDSEINIFDLLFWISIPIPHI